jgi:hypothetical protein
MIKGVVVKTTVTQTQPSKSGDMTGYGSIEETNCATAIAEP